MAMAHAAEGGGEGEARETATTPERAPTVQAEVSKAGIHLKCQPYLYCCIRCNVYPVVAQLLLAVLHVAPRHVAILPFTFFRRQVQSSD